MSGTPLFDNMKKPAGMGQPVTNPLGPTPVPLNNLSQSEFDKIIREGAATEAVRKLRKKSGK